MPSSLYEQVNKLQEYLGWTQKSEALSGWLKDTERSLDSCATPSVDLVEREKQTLFLAVRSVLGQPKAFFMHENDSLILLLVVNTPYKQIRLTLTFSLSNAQLSMLSY